MQTRGKNCYLCQRNLKEIDWKNVSLLKRFLSPSGKIRPRKKTHLCAKHQRKVALAVKKAREMAFLPYKM
mgnify:CR=1 FL=1|jgi:small subunit ribosomal protein S18